MLVVVTLIVLAVSWLLVLGGMATVGLSPLTGGSLVLLAVIAAAVLFLGGLSDETTLSLHPFYRSRLASAFAVRRVRRKDGEVVARPYTAEAAHRAQQVRGPASRGVLPARHLRGVGHGGGEAHRPRRPPGLLHLLRPLGRRPRAGLPPLPSARGPLAAPAAPRPDRAGRGRAERRGDRRLDRRPAHLLVRDALRGHRTAASGRGCPTRVPDHGPTRRPALVRAAPAARPPAELSAAPTVRGALGVGTAGPGHRRRLLRQPRAWSELFRRGGTRIHCIDASGDSPPAATTLSQALTLAHHELGVQTDLEAGTWRTFTAGSAEPLSPKDPLATLSARLSQRGSSPHLPLSARSPFASGEKGILVVAKSAAVARTALSGARLRAQRRPLPPGQHGRPVLRRPPVRRLHRARPGAGHGRCHRDGRLRPGRAPRSRPPGSRAQRRAAGCAGTEAAADAQA